MIQKIISGGQTGVDQAAFDVAIKLGIPHGGWVPKSRKTEEGKGYMRICPELFEQYRKAKDAVTTMWNQKGQHAFLHHLSAIFGYEPLVIQKWIRF